MKIKKSAAVLSVIAIICLVLGGLFIAKTRSTHNNIPVQPVTVAEEAGKPVAKPPVVSHQPIAIDQSWADARQAAGFWNMIDDARRGKVPQPASVIGTMLRDGDQLAASGNISGAQDKFRDALKDGSNDPAAWLKFADAAQANQNTQDAVSAYLIAETFKPADTQKSALYRGLAKIYTAGQGPQAREQSMRALQKALAVQADPDLQKQLDLLTGSVMGFKTVTTRTDDDVPEACLEFSQALNENGTVAYENFIAVEPAVKLSAVPAGNQICLKGFAYGQNYQLTLKSGLPSNSNVKLAKTENVPVSFNDRKPSLTFQGDTYILPRFNNVGVPLHGLNVDVAWVQILQINDRNLVNQMIEGDLFDKTIYNYAKQRLENDHGRSLWQGFLDLHNVSNKSVTTAIPFSDLIKDPVPGLYAVLAQPAVRKTDDDLADDGNTATPADIQDADYTIDQDADKIVQWLVVTDTGLTTYTGQDGLNVSAHSYSSGKPINGVKLRLLSRDNTIIAESQTDAAGHATFADALLRGEGGKQEKLLQAFNGKGDFTFLDLQQPTLDFSDRGVDGRAAVAKLDAFLYSDRDIYRPGDTFYLSALVRDTNAKALAAAPPVTAKIFRPDGVLFSQMILKASNPALGGYHTSLVIPENARMGMWHAELFADPTEPAIGSYSWQVEDFVPARLDVKLAVAKDSLLTPGQPLNVPVQANYLYGALAADAAGDARLDLRFAETTLFDDYKDYAFGGPDADFTNEQTALTLDHTNDKGQSSIAVKLDTVPPTSKPLEALLHVSIFDDSGRAVNRTAVIPVARPEPYLGLKELSTGQDDQDADWNFSAARSFAVVAVDRQGKPVTQDKLHYRLVKEEYHYDWYAASGERNYQGQIYDVPVKAGDLNVKLDKPGVIKFSGLDYGTYRLDIFDPTQTTDRLTFASTKFNVGWMERALTAKDKPDGLQLRLDKPHYDVGETAHLFVKAAFAGQAELVLARESVMERRSVVIPKDGMTIDLPVTENWGSGVYALVHAYRPGEKQVAGQDKTIPGRSVGIIWLGLDPKPRTLQIALDVPDKILPRQTLTVPVTVSGDGPAELTVAAVDEGILQLTGFATPDPDGYFYAKRELAVDVRDTYGRLLDPRVDALGQVRVGGDQAGRTGANLPSRWIKPLALFSGPVTVDANGHAEVKLTLPAFNGKVRLMAVAYNNHQVGHAERDVIIRDPVVVNLGLPRFMAVQDAAHLRLSLNDLDGADGVAKLSITTTGGLQAGTYPASITLAKQKKTDLALDLTATADGPASVQLHVAFADGSVFEQTWPLTVRPIQPYQTDVKTGVLPPGKTLRLDSDLLHDKIAQDAIVSFALNPMPDMQLPRVLKELDRYPYGCLEQTSSRLLPLLYLRDLVDQGVDVKKRLPADETIRNAIAHLFSMQRADGSFSLWNGYGETEEFLSLYAIDVLQRAQGQGYAVPDYALQRALAWLQRDVKLSDDDTAILHRRAYAYYLLAKARLIEPGQVRYFVERYHDDFANALTDGFVAAALTQIGDAAAAKEFWTKALSFDAAEKTSAPDEYADYGSTIRDRLIILTLAAEAKLPEQETAVFAAQLNGLLARQPYLSTQDDGWAVLAVHALAQQTAKMQASLNGEPLTIRPHQPLLKTWQGDDGLKDITTGQTVRNDGQTDLYYTTAVNAIAKSILPAAANGFAIERHFYTRDGKPADLQHVKANNMLIAVIDGHVTDHRIVDQALLVDLLPAGFELENAQFGQGQNVQDFAWVGAVSQPAYQELRDDRFIAAFAPQNLTATAGDEGTDDGDNNSDEPAKNPPVKPLVADQFRFAYALRAVTPGHYRVPAVSVEAMYQPEFQARTQPGEMDIR